MRCGRLQFICWILARCFLGIGKNAFLWLSQGTPLTAYNLTEEYEGANSPSDVADAGTLEKIFRHINFGAEVLLHKNFNLMIGYNYLIHEELKLENAGGMAGVSLGFSATIRSFEFIFSRSAYMVGNAGYTFTLSKNLETLLSRRQNLWWIQNI